MLIRPEDEPPQVVPEAALPTEAELHEALTKHPQLIPTSDLGMGRTVVVGRESGLSAGYADLVLMDDQGQICVVEVKNEGNPDTRRVVAQLLDYAASLWGLSVDEFERRVLHPFLAATGQTDPPPGIADYVAEALEQDSDGATVLPEQLGQALAAGEFALVVAAPQIPIGVQRVLEYLNARGQRLYGLEVSYFSGPVECFVPRLVVKPLSSDPASERGAEPLDQETFLSEVPEEVRDVIASFLDECAESGADILWRTYGPSIAVKREQQRQVAYLEPQRLAVTLQASGGFPQAPFDTARRALETLGVGTETKDAWYRRVPLAETDKAELVKALEVARKLVESLSPTVAFTALPNAIEVTFARNDHNIWARHVRPLADLQGRHLRGRLIHVSSGRGAEIDLLPLANNQPGWLPRFRPASAREELWPPASTGDRFTLTIEASS